MKKSLVTVAIVLTLGAGGAHAERGGHRQSFAIDKTRTTEKGTFTHHTEQNVSASGFTRDTIKTNPAGETATRDRSVMIDSATGARTGTVTGTTFGGKSYSGESVKQKTADGYTSSGSFTGVNGGTTSRSVGATVDKQNGTLTKDISVTTPSGEVHNSTVVKTIGRPDGGAE